MKIIFYNIVSLVLGLLVAYYAIQTLIKKKLKLFSILSIGVALLFVAFGIFGFCLPKEYEQYSFIVILGMLLSSIIEIILFMTLNKKEAPVKEEATKVKEEKKEIEETKEDEKNED